MFQLQTIKKEKLQRQHKVMQVKMAESHLLIVIIYLQEMEEQGLSIPDRIAAVGIDNTLTGRIYKPRLTTLDNKLVEVSENASRILLSALSGERVSHRMMLFTDIIEGETT